MDRTSKAFLDIVVNPKPKVTWDLQAYLDLCAAHKVDPRLFAAIIKVESSWDSYAVRYERDYSYTVDVEKHANALGIAPIFERTLQRTSFGLAQIMGGTARDLGYRGRLERLLEPAKSVEWGLRYFARSAARYPGRMTDQIAAYNAGSARKDVGGRYVNQGYVDKVLKALGSQNEESLDRIGAQPPRQLLGEGEI